MYDLNVAIPNLSSDKFSSEEKFVFLENYLRELNESLSVALGNKTQNSM